MIFDSDFGLIITVNSIDIWRLRYIIYYESVNELGRSVVLVVTLLYSK